MRIEQILKHTKQIQVPFKTLLNTNGVHVFTWYPNGKATVEEYQNGTYINHYTSYPNGNVLSHEYVQAVYNLMYSTGEVC